MKRRFAAAVLALALPLTLAATAVAQNLSLRAPDWAARLVAADLMPTTGGRASLGADGLTLSVRVTLAPYHGGVARVVRYDSGAQVNDLAVRRFTGHPNAGWWLYGPDTPLVTHPAAAVRAEIDRLARTAITASSLGSASDTENCPDGERIFVEIFQGGRSTSVTRACMGTDAVGALARRLSDLGGSRTEEELYAAAREEVLAADRAFNAAAQAHGLQAAFHDFAADDGVVFRDGAEPVRGPDAIGRIYANFPATAHITWAPEDARVSTRGDMAWTWGRATFTDAQGRAHPIQYVTVWTRDWEGNWKFAADLGVDGPAAH